MKNNEMTPDDMKEYLLDHREIFPEFFMEGAKPTVRKGVGLTPGQMADQIVYAKQFTKSVYDYYFRLSQFEHFSIATESQMVEPSHNYEMMYIVDVTNYLLDFLNINLGTLRVPLQFKERVATLINEFRSTNWCMDESES